MHLQFVAVIGFPKPRLSRRIGVHCGCLEAATVDSERTTLIAQNETRGTHASTMDARDEGLAGLTLQRFCSSAHAFKCDVTRDKISASLSDVGATASTRSYHVAWLITGGLRSFFAPLVHESIYQNAIRAVGGQPKLFLIASMNDDAKSARDVLSVVDARQSNCSQMSSLGSRSQRSTQACAPTGCTTWHANLSSFLAAKSEWAVLTVHVEEEMSSRVLSGDAAGLAVYNPDCPLPDELDKAFRPPHYLVQMARWSLAMSAVRRYEKRVGWRFHFVARMRFDVAVPAPLSSNLLRTDRAFLAFPPAVKVFQRMVPVSARQPSDKGRNHNTVSMRRRVPQPHRRGMIIT